MSDLWSLLDVVLPSINNRNRILSGAFRRCVIPIMQTIGLSLGLLMWGSVALVCRGFS